MSRRLTVDEYFRYPETLRPNELVFGLVREPPAPRYGHQSIVTRVTEYGGKCGRSKMENHNPFPFGETQCRPNRPRPLVCDSANTATPSFAPSRASFSITSFVDVVSLKTRTSRPTTFTCPSRDKISSACKTSGTLFK